MSLKSYSQLRQDIIAAAFFKLYLNARFFFLDIGAFDGLGFSNTRLLFEQGWSGICVEPVMKNYQKLDSLYRGTNVIAVRAAATDYEGEMKLNVATIPWAQEWGSDVSSSSDDVVKRWPDYNWKTEIVPAMTINKILENNNVSHVDFVTIDVEGHEMSVLRGFNLQKYAPLLLVVEYSSPAERQELINYMKIQGYVLWLDNSQDVFFVRQTALKNWRVLLYGFYQKMKYSRLARFATRLTGRIRL